MCVMKTLLAAKHEAPSDVVPDDEAGIGALKWGPGDAIRYTLDGLQPQPDEPGYKAVSLQPILDEIKQFEQEHHIGKKERKPGGKSCQNDAKIGTRVSV